MMIFKVKMIRVYSMSKKEISLFWPLLVSKIFPDLKFHTPLRNAIKLVSRLEWSQVTILLQPKQLPRMLEF